MKPTEMKPTVGRIVIYRQGDIEARQSPGTNNTREHPAIITRVWTDECVNLHVFLDAHPGQARTSIMRLPDLPQGVLNTSGASGWRWPDRAAS